MKFRIRGAYNKKMDLENAKLTEWKAKGRTLVDLSSLVSSLHRTIVIIVSNKSF